MVCHVTSARKLVRTMHRLDIRHSLEFPGPVKTSFFQGVPLTCDSTVDPLLPNHFKPSMVTYVAQADVSSFDLVLTIYLHCRYHQPRLLRELLSLTNKPAATAEEEALYIRCKMATVLHICSGACRSKSSGVLHDLTQVWHATLQGIEPSSFVSVV